MCQTVSLFILAKSLENFEYSKVYRLNILKQENESQHNIDAFLLQHKDEITFFKDRSIKSIVEAHGDFFSSAIAFNDWNTAMRFLEQNRSVIIDFILKD